MTKVTAWTSHLAILLACAVACGGSKSGDDDDSGAGESGESGSGGSGATGGTTGGKGGAGGAGGAQGGTGGTTGGTSTGGSGGTGGTTGGSTTGGSTSGGTGGSVGGTGGSVGGAGGSGGSVGGTAGLGGSGGTPAIAPGFTEGAVLAEGVSVSDDPKLAVNRAGDVLVVWPGLVETHTGIWTIRYDPTSATWGEPFAINTDDTYNAELEDLALDELGNAYIAWRQGNIFVTRYDAATATWMDSVQIEDHDAGTPGAPHVAAGPNGTASIIWNESDGSRSVQRNRLYDPESDEWSYWEAIDDRDYNNSSTGALAIDADGYALAAWTQSGESGFEGGVLAANHFDVENGAWGTPEVIVPQTPETLPVYLTITADGANNFFLVWEANSTELGGGAEVWARRYKANGEWDEPTKLEDQMALVTTEPDIAVDDAGNAIVVWTADDHLYSARYDAGAATWSPATKVDDTPGWVAKWASIALAPNGNALAVSSQYPVMDIKLEIDAVASRYDVNTDTWGPGGLLETHADSAFAPVVGMDGEGRGYVVWRTESEYELWLSVYEPD